MRSPVPFERFIATFKPEHMDDLRLEARDWIGWRGVWEAVWLIDEGAFEGQYACAVVPMQDKAPPADAFVWVPSGDLVDLLAAPRRPAF